MSVKGDERSSSALARRAIFTTAIAALAGSGVGLAAAARGLVAGVELALIVSCLLFAVGTLLTLLAVRSVAVQNVATASTIYFTFYLCAGSVIAVFNRAAPLDLFVYLVWFFPLLVYNKLVNSPAVGHLLARLLCVAPVLLVACVSPRLAGLFALQPLLPPLLMSYCLSYFGFALMLDTVTRYREEYIVERERAESLNFEATVLESISDCFISVDSKLRLTYLNDAACSEFGVARDTALGETLADAVPDFLSEPARAQVRLAAAEVQATIFEVRRGNGDTWYELRCFPRLGAMSIYFRNITETVSSRSKLAQAHQRLSEQAELLDKAQDAIFVMDMDGRFIYWNKGAERLYGWTSAEIVGHLVGDIFHDAFAEMNANATSVFVAEEWDGELSQCRRDGSTIVVESRCTLVLAQDGQPRSILAINTDITKRKAAEAKIMHLGFYDVLTELPNRLLLRERMERAMDAAARTANVGALLFIDLDDFKTLNDTLGHDIGDLFLTQVARRLKSCARVTDTVARLGGDEFVVLLEGLNADTKAAAAQAKAVADKILGAFLRPYHVAHREYTGTASIGIALFFPNRAGSVDDVLRRGDLAMYRAKAQGRNTMCFFDPEMQTFVTSRAMLQSDLRQALQNREFELHYQPQVHRDGSVRSGEALLRWQHPTRGMVPPDEFIPLAEEAGLIVELGRWVLESACSQLARWATRPELAYLHVAVNVSLRQLVDPDFVSLVLDVLRVTGANPARLMLEITESTMMEKVDDTIAKMTALKAHGVAFSLDDFGTGYSSLSYLKRLPLDQLKIDRSFVSDVLTGDTDASIARTIIALGRNLGLAVIAEGVETQGQCAFFEDEGCYVYQGFLFSKAIPAEGFEAYVAAAFSDSAASNQGPPSDHHVSASPINW